MTKLGQDPLSLPLLESSFLSTKQKSRAAGGERTADPRPRWPHVPIGGVSLPWDVPPFLIVFGCVESSLAWVGGYTDSLGSVASAVPLAFSATRQMLSEKSIPHPGFLRGLYPCALSTPVTMIIVGRRKGKLCPQPLSPLNPHPWRRHPRRYKGVNSGGSEGFGPQAFL